MERDTKFDNIKAILIFFVVFGHSLEFLFGMAGIYGYFRAFIYSFHMPAFIFLSGYFSKESKKTITHTILYLLFTYAIFNTLFSFTPWQRYATWDLLTPEPIYWYLLSLCFWKILTPVICNVRYIFPISIIFTLYVGLFPPADRFLSISRVICFLPFFIAGYFFKNMNFERIGKLFYSILLSICFIVTLLLHHFNMIPLKMYEYIQSYESTNVANSHGVLMRFTMLIISFVIIICLINLVPSRQCKFTIWGKNSLMIYLLHIYPILKLSDYNLFSNNHPAINLGISFILSSAICIVLSIPYISAVYKRIMRYFVNKICLK